jgi:hypothetical protein
MAGYSGTPLVRKLGIRDGFRVFAEGAPADYTTMLDPLPAGVELVRRFSPSVDLVHLFAMKRGALERRLAALRRRMKSDGVVWVSWPKKASGIPSEVTEDVIREIALPLGFVDTKVCAVDETWSGLKLVIRVELR